MFDSHIQLATAFTNNINFLFELHPVLHQNFSNIPHSDIPEFLYLTTTRKPLRFKFELFTQCVATWKQDTEKTFYIIKLIVLYM